PTICLAAPERDAPKTAGDAREAHSASDPHEENAASNDVPEPPSPQTARRESRLAGVGIRLSTLGAGAEVGVSLSNRLNVRGGVNIFQYNRGLNHHGVTYQGQLTLRSLEAHLDWYPLGHVFHLNPPLIVHNATGASDPDNIPGGS